MLLISCSRLIFTCNVPKQTNFITKVSLFLKASYLKKYLLQDCVLMMFTRNKKVHAKRSIMSFFKQKLKYWQNKILIKIWKCSVILCLKGNYRLKRQEILTLLRLDFHPTKDLRLLNYVDFQTRFEEGIFDDLWRKIGILELHYKYDEIQVTFL